VEPTDGGSRTDSRSLNFAGNIDEPGRPLPMTVEVLRGRTEKWPISSGTPEHVAAQLPQSRQLFVNGYYIYKNFAATRSLQPVEAALRARLDAGTKPNFAQLIDRAEKQSLIDHEALGSSPLTQRHMRVLRGSADALGQ
jgi:hypothetical protein